MTKNFVVEGVNGRYFEAGEIGTLYRFNDGVFEYQPMPDNGLPIEDAWGAVEEDLVGDETVVYNSTEMTLSEVYKIVRRELEASIERKVRRLTEEEVREAVKKVMTWETEKPLDRVVQAICDGKSVIVDAVCYRGNGRYESSRAKDRYKYKMFVPFVDKRGNIYSTDLFKEFEYAKDATFEVYTFTRQKVLGVVAIFETDWNTAWERFGFGYTERDWGQERIYVMGRSFTPPRG